MKRVFSAILILVLCFSFCACGSADKSKTNNNTTVAEESGSGKKTILITTEELKAGFEGCEGKLDYDSTDAYGMARFRKTITDINASKVLDKDFATSALAVYLQDPTALTDEQKQVCNAYNGLICLQKLFEYDIESFTTEAYIEDLVAAVCDKKTVGYNNWIITIEVDVVDDKIVIEGDNTYKHLD